MALPRREILAVTAPGLEAVVAQELEGIGWHKPRQVPGGVTATGGSEAIWRACLWSRTATDIRVRVGRFRTNTLEGLAQGVRRLPWSLFLRPTTAFKVSVSSRGSRMKRRSSVARKVELAIADALRGPRLPERGGRARRQLPETTVHVRLQEQQAQLSVSAPGGILHQRGWRAAGGSAPIRENLAAAVLWAAGWRPGATLMDPFAGSGTFLIEAATIARGIPPGHGRRFAFEAWPCHRPKQWRAIANEKGEPCLDDDLFWGQDASQAAVERARANARQAGISRWVQFRTASVDSLQPTGSPGLVVANPPYGHRIGQRVAGVYRDFGRRLKEDFAGWRLALLCPQRELVQQLRLPLEPLLSFPHGGLQVTLWVGPASPRAPDAPEPAGL